MIESRRIFKDADGTWMELTAEELLEYRDHPQLVRWFTTVEAGQPIRVPTSQVTHLRDGKVIG